MQHLQQSFWSKGISYSICLPSYSRLVGVHQPSTQKSSDCSIHCIPSSLQHCESKVRTSSHIRGNGSWCSNLPVIMKWETISSFVWYTSVHIFESHLFPCIFNILINQHFYLRFSKVNEQNQCQCYHSSKYHRGTNNYF